MMTEIPENVTKLLIHCGDSRVTAWQLGQHGIYQADHRPINTTPDLKENAPSLVKVRYDSDSDIKEFLRATNLRACRVFKTAQYKAENLPPTGFFYHAAKNLLGLYKYTEDGKTCFRISSDSRTIRDKFYEIALKINEEYGYEHTFDYDEYDVDFILNVFNDGDRKLLVTYLIDPREAKEESPE